jgi:hypothetical protein
MVLSFTKSRALWRFDQIAPISPSNWADFGIKRGNDENFR